MLTLLSDILTSAIMWTPTDEYALPSKEDAVNALGAIEQLKIDIEDAIVKLNQAQLHLDNLKTELCKREAWLAPVRRLTFDVLSSIFIMCAEHSWMAPMSLSLVCRVWRTTILAVPSAWSFIDLKHERALGFWSLFTRHSGHYPLHVGLDGYSWTKEIYFKIEDVSDRITCLKVPTLTYLQQTTSFPILKRLSIINETPKMELALLNPSRFPVLQHLQLTHYDRPDSLAFTTMTDLPALQSLVISIYDGPTTINPLRKWGENLRYLTLHIYCGSKAGPKYCVDLPRLEDLAIYDNTHAKIAYTMTTPALKYLTIDNQLLSSNSPFQLDLGHLVHVCFAASQNSPLIELPPLIELVRVRVLQFSIAPNSFIKILKSLTGKASICPKLEVIEYLSPNRLASTATLVHEMITKINDHDGRNIRFISGNKWQITSPQTADQRVSEAYLYITRTDFLIVWTRDAM